MTLARWQATIVNEAGNVLPEAQITVRREVAGTPLAGLYSDRDGIIPAGNPITAGPDGFASFHVAGGAYRIDAVSGSFTRTWRYVGIGTAAEFDAGGGEVFLIQAVDAGYSLMFETATGAPPSTGAIRFNNTDLSLATEAYVSAVNAGGSEIAQLLLDLFNPARTRPDAIIISNPNTNKQASFQVQGAVLHGSPPSAYVTLTIGGHSGETSFGTGVVSFQRERAGVNGAAGTGGREKLTANRTYFVRTDGNDGNAGLADSAGGAFRTVQKAVDVAYGTLDLGQFDVDIQLRTGTFARAVVTVPQVGKGVITIRGDAATPANVIMTAASIGEFAGVVDATKKGVITVRDLTLTTTGTGGSCLCAQTGGAIFFSNIRFGACISNHCLANKQGYIEATGDYAIVGAAARHVLASELAQVAIQGRTITLTDTPAFSSEFICADAAGAAVMTVNTYSGAATGKRFTIRRQGFIYALGGLTEFPGSIAGTVESGGIHPALGEQQSFVIACSDLTSSIGAGTFKIKVRMPYAFTLTEIPRASLYTVQNSGAIFTVDVNKSNVSVLSTKLTIDNGEATSTTAATPAVLSSNTIGNDEEISIDVDQVGDGTAKGLIVTLIGCRA